MIEMPIISGDGLRLDAALHPATGRPGLGTVIQAHGITVDMDEGGMFVRLAERLAEAGFTVLRFSFRGHGESDGTQLGVTIAGEMLDVQAAAEYAMRSCPPPLSMVAASFGAVSVALSLPYLARRLHRLVLWNPVLDLRDTFIEPELAWGIENFNAEQQGHLVEDGFLLIDGKFKLGRVMFEEMRYYRPEDYFVRSDVDSLIVHGDQDSYVSFDVARRAAEAHRNCAFHPVVGSDHGFDSPEREDEAIKVTVDWLSR